MTVCFDRSEQRAYQDAIDTRDMRDEAIARRTEELHDEIYTKMMIGMSGDRVALPYVRTGTFGDGRECTQPLCEAVLIALDSEPCMHQLLLVLAESTCPIVRQLKVDLCTRYAADNANDLAMLEVGT